ncbi:ferritin [Candidatus Izimaplasma bacterium ZiA1]|uniref:ferritin n=1 Tax=Candidatus Izimoplasma sp. ZiA1 TaxID=2024899 RepID=UPI000BAA5A09|nr:ferritin [Candidatus Izimaplasma bacterium ZiA1]
MNNKLENAINDQINFEIESAHIYLAMQSYISTLGLEGFENWMGVQYQEELFHAKTMIAYLNERGGRVNIRGFADPENEFKSLLDVFETSLAHELKVTARINNIMTIAHEVKDYAAISFFQWFVDEQVEEEDSFGKMIDKIKLVKDSGLYLLDKEAQVRVFTEPVVK